MMRRLFLEWLIALSQPEQEHEESSREWVEAERAVVR